MKISGKLAEPAATQPHRSPTGQHHKVPVVWILAADTHIARLYRKNSDHSLEGFGEIEPSKHRKAGGTLGRLISSCSRAIHHRLEPRMTPQRKEALTFIHELALWLDAEARKNAFDRLVLAAAPRTLGDLRQVLTQPVQTRIAAEVDKDLTKMNERELHAELERIVWF